MLVVLGIISAGLLGFIIYLAFSRASSKLLKMAAFIALALIALTLLVNVIFLIVGPGEETGEGGIPLPIFAESPEQPSQPGGSVFEAVIFLVIFAIIIGFIIVLSARDRRKRGKIAAAKKTASAGAFTKAGKRNPIESKPASPQNEDFGGGMDFDDD